MLIYIPYMEVGSLLHKFNHLPVSTTAEKLYKDLTLLIRGVNPPKTDVRQKDHLEALVMWSSKEYNGFQSMLNITYLHGNSLGYFLCQPIIHTFMEISLNTAGFLDAQFHVP